MSEQQISPAPKHRTAKGARRIHDLTAVAAELFLERGFESVAVDDLIARVGGSRRNVYSHFGGKEGLFIESMTRLCMEVARPLEQLNIEEGKPREALTSFGRRLLQSVLEPRTLSLHRLLVAEGKRFPELAQAMLNAGYRKAVERLAVWIATRQSTDRSEILGDLPATVLAEQFIAMVTNEAQLRALVGLDTRPLNRTQIDHIVSYAVATFLQGALVRRGS